MIKENIRDTTLFPDFNVLLVEDSEVNQQIVSEILKSAGITVTLASNGIEAVEKATSGNFDLVLMDIQMPEMDGYEATKIIRQNPRLKELPIIAMTANALIGDRERCLAAGMTDYMGKPIILKHFKNVVSKWINTDKYPSDAQSITKKTEKSFKDESSVVDIPGLNVKKAFLKLENDQSVYTNALVSFYNNYETASIDLNAQLKKGEIKEVELFAHTIKGLAGAIGADELEKIAAKLEGSFRENQLASIFKLAEAFQLELKTVLNHLQPFVENIKSEETTETNQKTTPFVLEEFLTLLTKLETNLKMHNKKQSKTCLEEIQIIDLPKEAIENFDIVKTFINKYQFKNAIDKANQIKNELT